MLKTLAQLCMILCLFLACNCAGNRIHTIPFSDEREMTIYHGIYDSAEYGIHSIILFLDKDNKYKAEIEYANVKQDAEVETHDITGTYQLKNGSITLSANDSLIYPLTYQIGEGILTSETNKSFILKLIANPIYESNWNLVELNGTAIQSDPQNTREPGIIFKLLSKRVFGSGGCNRFSGMYEISDKHIRISRVISTKMACMEVTYENDYFRILGSVNGYSVSGDTLLLTINGSVAARFTDAGFER